MRSERDILRWCVASALVAGCAPDAVIVERDLRERPAGGVIAASPGRAVDGERAVRNARVEPVDVSAGDLHVCARGSDQGVYCWGDNHRGQVGDAELLTPHTLPQRAGCQEGVREVIAGAAQTGVITAEGAFQYWGRNDHDPLASGVTHTSCKPVGLKRFDDVIGAVLSERYTLAWNRHDEVVGWNASSPLALIADIPRQPARHRWFEGSFDVAMNARAESGHACVRNAQGVDCWGYVPAQGGDVAWFGPFRYWIRSGASRVAAGHDFTCVVSNERVAWCWGANRAGQLGVGNTRDQVYPQRVPVPGEVMEVATGRQHVCALTLGGEVWCWGANGHGQLGALDPEIQSVRPVRVAALPPAEHVTAGLDFTCALTRDRQVWCWGANKEAQLGVGDNVAHDGPVRARF